MVRSDWKIGFLFLGVMLAAASQATAQADLQFFAPPELSNYDRKPRANEGFYAHYSYLAWWISAPDRATIGNDQIVPRAVVDGRPVFGRVRGIVELRDELNTLDTGMYQMLHHTGNLFEVGYVEGNDGFNVRLMKLYNKTQTVAAGDVNIIMDGLDLITFLDQDLNNVDDDLDGDGVFGRNGVDLFPPFGFPDTPAPTDLDDAVGRPLVFDELTARLETEFWTVEINRIMRMDRLPYGAYFEWYHGLRYMEFNEAFKVTARGGALNKSEWNTKADQNIIGPQIGARWFRQTGPWMLSIDGRFAAMLNFQAVRQRGILGDEAGQPGPALLQLTNLTQTSFSHRSNFTEFVPLLEFGFHASYQVTRSITLHAGWRALLMDGIARPNKMVNYTFPSMGILADANTQEVFIHGLEIGANLNW